MRSRTKAAALAVAVIASVVMTGCGQRVAETEKQTEKQTETEAVTEIIIVTEAPQTEPPTETEAVTEAVTEAPTEPDVDLSAEEELATIDEYTDMVTLYANDDLNIRSEPSTEQGAETVFASYLQGEEASVTGETKHWYRVLLSDGESVGYVHKDGLSETVVEPKTDEERSAAADAEAIALAEDGAAVSSDYAAAENTYAESFSIVIASDANLRADASETSNVIGVVSAGSTATAIGETGDWYQIEYDGTVGYVHKNLVG